MECRMAVMSESTVGHPFPKAPHGQKGQMVERMNENLSNYRSAVWDTGMKLTAATWESMVMKEITAMDLITKVSIAMKSGPLRGRNLPG